MAVPVLANRNITHPWHGACADRTSTCATFETVGEKTSFFLFPDTFLSIVSISRFHYEKKLKTECVFRDLAAAMENKKENAFLYLMKETDLHKSLLP